MSQLRDAGRQDRSGPEEDLGELELQDESLLRRTERSTKSIDSPRTTNESILDFSDLMSLTFRGDAVQGFDTGWDEVLLSMGDTPKDDKLESMY